MAKADIVKTLRGANGGYKLNSEMTDINMYDIIYAIDREFMITECSGTGYDCPNNGSNCCLVHKEFKDIQVLVEEKLKSISINDIWGI